MSHLHPVSPIAFEQCEGHRHPQCDTWRWPGQLPAWGRGVRKCGVLQPPAVRKCGVL